MGPFTAAWPITRGHTPKKTNFHLPSNYVIAPQLWVSMNIPFHDGISTGLILHRSCVGNNRSGECMGIAVLSSPGNYRSGECMGITVLSCPGNYKELGAYEYNCTIMSRRQFCPSPPQTLVLTIFNFFSALSQVCL